MIRLTISISPRSVSHIVKPLITSACNRVYGGLWAVFTEVVRADIPNCCLLSESPFFNNYDGFKPIGTVEVANDSEMVMLKLKTCELGYRLEIAP